MKSIHILCSALMIACLTFIAPQSSFAQLFGNKEVDKPSAELVPRSAFMGVAVFPIKIAANPALRLFPHEVVTAWGNKELGFDPMLIKQITLVVKELGDTFPPQGEPGWAAILHFEKMQGLSGAMIDKLEEKKIAGKTVYDGSGTDVPSFMVYDESTMIVGNSSFFEELITTSGKGKLAEMFSAGKVNGQAQMFVHLEPVRFMIREALSDLDNFELPLAVENLRQIPDLVDSFEIGMDTDNTLETKLILHTANSNDAEHVKELIVEGMKYGKMAMLTSMAAEFDAEDPVQVAMIAYAKRIAEKYETKFTPELDGADLTIVAHEEILAMPMMLGMVGGMSRGTMFPQRMRPDLQLRQTALAMHNYESAYRHFPARTIKDENGKALFSGRTAILPFIEQNNLYSQLRMDEPWDSKHNSQFTSVSIPTFGEAEGGKSTLRFPVFPGSAWDSDEPLKFSDITDGSSNTILAIHAPESAAISWADPTPWKISENNPMRDVFGDRDEVEVAMMDGSARKLKKADMTNEKLKAMLTIAGGEVIDWEIGR